MPEKKTYLGRLAEEIHLFHKAPAQQFAALCYRRIEHETRKVEVLLITTRESRRWTIPKGWPIPGLEAHQAAEREAWEEAGVTGNAWQKPFGYYTYLKSLETGKRVPSVVQVHLLEVQQMAEDYPEKAQRTVQWLDPYQAAALIREPELQSLLRRIDSSV